MALGRKSEQGFEPFGWSPVADELAYALGQEYLITEAHLLDPASGVDEVLVSGGGTQRFNVGDMVWAPSGRWLAFGRWEERGDGNIEHALQIVDLADPSSFEQFAVDTLETWFLVDWSR